MCDSDSSEPEQSTVISEVLDLWLDRPINDPFSGAYHIGRLVNALNWFLQHALVYRAPAYQGPILDVIFGQLVSATYTLVNSPPNRLARAVESVHAYCKHCLGSERAANFINLTRDDRFSRNRESLTTEIEEYVLPTVRNLLGIISQELTETQKWAMELGSCLDEGIRRSDVYRFFDGGVRYEEVPAQPDQSLPSPIATKKLRRQQWRTFQPGELEPGTAWPYKLRQLLSKIAMPPDTDVVMQEFLQSKAPSQRNNALPGLLDTLDRSIRQHLQDLNDRTSQRASSNEEPTTAVSRIDLSNVGESRQSATLDAEQTLEVPANLESDTHEEQLSPERRNAVLAELTPRIRLAYMTREIAVKHFGEFSSQHPTEVQLHDWLNEEYDFTSDSVPEALQAYMLPTIETWRRYTADARRRLGELRYTKRNRSATGRSFVRPEQLD